MAKRLATEYVKTHIRLKEAEMIKFVELFREHDIHIQVRVFDNGNQEVVLEYGDEPEVTLNFEHLDDDYVFDGACSFRELAPANAMRKAISVFHGNAIARRHYGNFIMEYRYEGGAISSITEIRPGGYERVVYRYRNKLAELQEVYERTDVEESIAQVKEEINQMLDLRRRIDRNRVKELDERLAVLSRRLFALEA